MIGRFCSSNTIFFFIGFVGFDLVVVVVGLSSFFFDIFLCLSI